VPIGIASGVVGGSYGALSGGLDGLSHVIVGSGRVGLFVYGVANRLLIVTGLHHILNNVAWFIVGDFHGSTGDLKRFFAGDPTAGAFMAGGVSPRPRPRPPQFAASVLNRQFA